MPNAIMRIQGWEYLRAWTLLRAPYSETRESLDACADPATADPQLQRSRSFLLSAFACAEDTTPNKLANTMQNKQIRMQPLPSFLKRTQVCLHIQIQGASTLPLLQRGTVMQQARGVEYPFIGEARAHQRHSDRRAVKALPRHDDLW